MTTARANGFTRMTPESMERGKSVYRCVASTAFGGAIVSLAVHLTLVAIGLLLVVLGAAFILVLCRGYAEGYQEAISHCSDDAKRSTDELRAAASPCDLAIESTASPEGEGFLYVLRFSTGTVKVGQTWDLRRRISEHRRNAEAYNVAITSLWTSPPHVNYLDNEIALIGYCDGLSVKARREYFHEIEFQAVVDFALRELTYYSATATEVTQ